MGDIIYHSFQHRNRFFPNKTLLTFKRHFDCDIKLILPKKKSFDRLIAAFIEIQLKLKEKMQKLVFIVLVLGLCQQDVSAGCSLVDTNVNCKLVDVVRQCG